MQTKKIHESAFLILHPGDSIQCDEGTVTVLIDNGTATFTGDAVHEMVSTYKEVES